MAVRESFRVSTLIELRRRGVLAVNCAGQPLILFYNGGRPCAVERPHSPGQLDRVCPSTYLSVTLHAVPVPPLELEVRGEEIWVIVARPRYKEMIAWLRRFASRLRGECRHIVKTLRAPRVNPTATLRRSSRRTSPSIFEGE
jgi:hypothetical protein